MEDEWWNVLVEVIVNAKKKNDGDLALKKLEIIGCPLMSDEMKEVITFALIHNYSSLIIIICKRFNMEHHLLTLFTLKFKHF